MDKQKILLEEIEKKEEELLNLKNQYVENSPFNVGDKVKVYNSSLKKKYIEATITNIEFSNYSISNLLYTCITKRRDSFPVFSSKSLDLIEKVKND